jgi:hypothetical protein
VAQELKLVKTKSKHTGQRKKMRIRTVVVALVVPFLFLLLVAGAYS